jgi:hypothetical protein
MNKLITTNNGGYPFVLDDLRFVDDSVRESFKNTFRAYGGTTNSTGFLISFDLDPNDVYSVGSTIPETAVFMNGEIWTLPSFTLPNPTAGSLYLWIASDIAFTNSAPGLKVLQNGTSVNSYQTRKATTYLSNVAGGGGMESTFPAFYYNQNDGGWQILQTASFKHLHNNKTGLNATNTNLETTNANVATNTTNIASHETRLDAIDAPWTKLSGANLTARLKFKTALGTGAITAFGAGVGVFDATSYVKYKVIGKTCFFSIWIENLIFPKAVSGIAPIGGLVFEFTDLTFSDITGSISISERNLPSPITNVGTIRKQSNNSFDIYPNNFGEESGGVYNYNYLLNTGTLSGTTGTLRKGGAFIDTVTSPKWSFRGSFVFEIN